MQKQISPKDWESLSAYLDGQQKPRERARLEARLHADSDLKAALVELQRTRSVLRSSPRLRAPRNFMLKPEMVGQSTRANTRLYPAFRFASALASLLFVIVVLSDITGISRRVFVPSGKAIPQPMEFAAPQADTAPSVEMMEAPATEEPSAAAEMPAQESPVEGGRSIEEPATESFALEVSEAEDEAAPPISEPRVESAPAAEPLAQKAGEPITETVIGAEQGVNLQEESVASAAPATPELQEANEGETAGEEVREELLTEIQKPEESPTPEVFENRESRSTISGWSLVRFFEIILGVVTLILAGITIFLRRQTH